jgi:Fic family protein
MVSLKKKELGGKTYYYLSHTYREKGKVKYREVYLGTKQPRNLEKIKKKFLLSIYSEKWFSQFDRINLAYRKDLRRQPIEIKVKETETFAVKFTYNTSKIEGSKLTLRETGELLENGISPKGRPIRDIKEAEAHKKVFYEAIAYSKDLSLSVVLKWHAVLFGETKSRQAGRFRDYQVAISGSKFVPPTPVEIYPLITDFFKWYERNKAKTHPVELAALVHLKFVTIHPFGDGNGRISRLMMNFVLHKHGYPMLDILYENRSGYYTALERAQVKQEDNVFLQWLFKKYLKENKRYLQSK